MRCNATETRALDEAEGRGVWNALEPSRTGERIEVETEGCRVETEGETRLCGTRQIARETFETTETVGPHRSML